MNKDEFYYTAKKIHADNIEKEIERIADDLREKESKAKKKLLQDKCSHRNTHSYNHGYHTICEDCGAEV